MFDAPAVTWEHSPGLYPERGLGINILLRHLYSSFPLCEVGVIKLQITVGYGTEMEAEGYNANAIYFGILPRGRSQPAE